MALFVATSRNAAIGSHLCIFLPRCASVGFIRSESLGDGRNVWLRRGLVSWRLVLPTTTWSSAGDAGRLVSECGNGPVPDCCRCRRGSWCRRASEADRLFGREGPVGLRCDHCALPRRQAMPPFPLCSGRREDLSHAQHSTTSRLSQPSPAASEAMIAWPNGNPPVDWCAPSSSSSSSTASNAF